jgi:hypothetical protein
MERVSIRRSEWLGANIRWPTVESGGAVQKNPCIGKSKGRKGEFDTLAVMPQRAHLAVVYLGKPKNRNATIVQCVVVKFRAHIDEVSDTRRHNLVHVSPRGDTTATARRSVTKLKETAMVASYVVGHFSSISPTVSATTTTFRRIADYTTKWSRRNALTNATASFLCTGRARRLFCRELSIRVRCLPSHQGNRIAPSVRHHSSFVPVNQEYSFA